MRSGIGANARSAFMSEYRTATNEERAKRSTKGKALTGARARIKAGFSMLWSEELRDEWN